MSVYDRAASTYGMIGPGLFPYFGDRLVQQFNIPPGAKILDVACGTGASLTPASDAVGSRGLVVGVDLSFEMLQRVGKEHGMPFGSFCLAQMSAERLGFKESSFDIVLCGFALSGFRNWKAALNHFLRVLKPGGRLGFTISPGWWWQSDPGWRWHAELMQSLGYGGDPQDVSKWRPNELKVILKRHGFVDVNIVTETFPLEFKNFNEWWNWNWSHGYRLVLERMTIDERAEYKTSCKAMLGHQASIETVLDVTIASAMCSDRYNKDRNS